MVFEFLSEKKFWKGEDKQKWYVGHREELNSSFIFD